MNKKPIPKSNESLPVFEAEIVEENIEKSEPVYQPKVAKTTLVQKLGTAIGALASIAGLISEFKSYFPQKRNNPGKHSKRRKQKKYMRRRQKP